MAIKRNEQAIFFHWRNTRKIAFQGVKLNKKFIKYDAFMKLNDDTIEPYRYPMIKESGRQRVTTETNNYIIYMKNCWQTSSVYY